MLKDMRGQEFKVGQQALYLCVGAGLMYIHKAEVIKIEGNVVWVTVMPKNKEPYDTSVVENYGDLEDSEKYYGHDERVIVLDTTEEFPIVNWLPIDDRFKLMDI